jgi:hypothetical protein
MLSRMHLSNGWTSFIRRGVLKSLRMYREGMLKVLSYSVLVLLCLARGRFSMLHRWNVQRITRIGGVLRPQ